MGGAASSARGNTTSGSGGAVDANIAKDKAYAVKEIHKRQQQISLPSSAIYKPPSGAGKASWTPTDNLFVACELGHEEKLIRGVNAGAVHTYSINSFGETLLIIAVREGYLELVRTNKVNLEPESGQWAQLLFSDSSHSQFGVLLLFLHDQVQFLLTAVSIGPPGDHELLYTLRPSKKLRNQARRVIDDELNGGFEEEGTEAENGQGGEQGGDEDADDNSVDGDDDMSHGTPYSGPESPSNPNAPESPTMRTLLPPLPPLHVAGASDDIPTPSARQDPFPLHTHVYHPYHLPRQS